MKISKKKIFVLQQFSKCTQTHTYTYPKQVLDNVAYRVARGVVGFGVLCDGFHHDMGNRGMRGQRAVVHFSHACFKEAGKDSYMTMSKTCP